jgi:hypothetical protein
VDDNHLYKKRKIQEIVHYVEETFAQQFSNFMRKNQQYVVSMPILEINLDLGTTVQQPFDPSSADSAPNRDKDKYPVDDINGPTPCTLIYVKGRTSRTIKVPKAIVMPSRVLHGRPVPTECAVVEVTTIREGHEFEDLDYPDEDEGSEKLVDAKGTFILWPHKDIIVKTCSSSIVLPWSTEAGGTPTSNMSKPAQNKHPLATPRPAKNREDLELQESTGRRLPSPVKESQGLELLDSRERRPPSPPTQVSELQDTKGKSWVFLWLKTKTSRTPRGKGHLLLLSKTFICILLQSSQSSCLALIELLLHSSRFMRLLRIVCLVAFLFPGKKFRTLIRMLVDKCLKLLNHSERRLWWMNPTRIMRPQC